MCSNAEATPAKGLQPSRKTSSKKIETYGQTQTTDRELSIKLFAALHQLRFSLTNPPKTKIYDVYTNLALEQMTNNIPKKKDDLLEIPGIDSVKMTKYGDLIMETIETTICEHYNLERHNTTLNENINSFKRNVPGESSNVCKLIELTRTKKRAKRLSTTRAGTTHTIEMDAFGARMLIDLAKSSDAARLDLSSKDPRKDPSPNKSTAPLSGSHHEAQAEESSHGPCVGEQFLVSFPPACEAPDIMARMCTPEATTALSHLSNERTRIEATRNFALSTYHAGNLLASHEALENANTRLQARTAELSLENNQLSQSMQELKGEVENLKSALQEKDTLLAEMKRESEEREQKLKDQLREAEETRMNSMAEAKDAWKREFLDRITHMTREF